MMVVVVKDVDKEKGRDWRKFEKYHFGEFTQDPFLRMTIITYEHQLPLVPILLGIIS